MPPKKFTPEVVGERKRNAFSSISAAKPGVAAPLPTTTPGRDGGEVLRDVAAPSGAHAADWVVRPKRPPNKVIFGSGKSVRIGS